MKTFADRWLLGICVLLLPACQDAAHKDLVNAVTAQVSANLVTSQDLLPDLQTVVPLHLQIQNTKQKETIRFSNGIANTGAGPLYLRPEFPGSGSANYNHQEAWQRIFADNGTYREQLVSTYEFHPDHNHWHIDAVAQFLVCKDLSRPAETQVGGAGVKVTFCLVDWYKMEGQSKTPDRTFFACDRNADKQGISVGWVDQYHQAIPGQELDITGAPAGDYYLISQANPDQTFVESNYQNNTAWVKFRLIRHSQGNPQLQVIDQSVKTGPLAGEGAPNR